eukprot:g25439.t1
MSLALRLVLKLGLASPNIPTLGPQFFCRHDRSNIVKNFSRQSLQCLTPSTPWLSSHWQTKNFQQPDDLFHATAVPNA